MVKGSGKKVRKGPGSSGGDSVRPSSPGDAPATRPLSKQEKKKEKHKGLLDRVLHSGAAARQAQIAKHKPLLKKKGAVLQSIGSLFDALPEVAAAAKPSPAFLQSAKGRVVRAKARIRLCHSETERIAAVMDNAQFQADPLSAVVNHVLNSVPPPPDTEMRRARSGNGHSHGHGLAKKRLKAAPGAGDPLVLRGRGEDDGRGRPPPPHDVQQGFVRKRRVRR